MTNMTTVLEFKEQVDYDDDNNWSQWYMAAKRSIIMDSTTTQKSAPYFINPNIMGGSATRVSSLASTNRSNATPCPGGGANPREDAGPYGIHSVLGPSMITDRRESNCEMDEENNRGYKYAEEMQQMEKTEINLLDWMNVDLENTGQVEIDDDWRKPRAIEIQGGDEEQQIDDKDGDSVITNKSGYQEAEGNLGESSVLDEKKIVRNNWRKQWELS